MPRNSSEAVAKPTAVGRKNAVRRAPTPGRGFWTSSASPKATANSTTVMTTVYFSVKPIAWRSRVLEPMSV
jgi:hypothetical protein